MSSPRQVLKLGPPEQRGPQEGAPTIPMPAAGFMQVATSIVGVAGSVPPAFVVMFVSVSPTHALGRVVKGTAEALAHLQPEKVLIVGLDHTTDHSGNVRPKLVGGSHLFDVSCAKGQELREIVDNFEKDFGYIVVNGGCLGNGSDAMIVAHRCSGAILAVEPNDPQADLLRTQSLLTQSGVRLLGFTFVEPA